VAEQRVRGAELTARERAVMALVAVGLSNDQIAEHLVVTRAEILDAKLAA
jgi:ATP/maltotriose-dependent transcriptional regulator MalT